jgi:ATP phosphoribosyltransferase
MTDNKIPPMRLAVPSKGELERPTLDFLAAAGLRVLRPNERQYVASIPSIPDLLVLFQRVPDILVKVDEGSVDLGITGYDVLREQGEELNNTVIIYENLGFGQCELALAVPESWVDISNIEDLAELTLLYKEKGKVIRIATKYPNLTKKWLHDMSIYYFTLVEAQGALEAAPSIGYADMIADITSTGTTLRENRLKKLNGGTVLKAQACLIGNRRALLADPAKLETTRTMIEMIEATLRAKGFLSLTANIQGASPEAILHDLLKEKGLAGVRGPTIAKVFSKTLLEEDWYAVTVVVEQKTLARAVDHMRRVGGTDITVTSLNYYFDSKSWNFEALLEKIKRT